MTKNKNNTHVTRYEIVQLVNDVDFNRQIRELVKDEMTKHDFYDSISKLIDKISLEQTIKDRTKKVIPEIVEKWCDNNLNRLAENTCERFMKNNFRKLFDETIKNDHSISSFVNVHLAQIKNTVRATTEQAINEIISEHDKFRPIFDAYYRKLETHNKAMVMGNMEEFKQKIIEMETSIYRLRFFARVVIAGIFFYSISIISKL